MSSGLQPLTTNSFPNESFSFKPLRILHTLFLCLHSLFVLPTAKLLRILHDLAYDVVSIPKIHRWKASCIPDPVSEENLTAEAQASAEPCYPDRLFWSESLPSVHPHCTPAVLHRSSKPHLSSLSPLLGFTLHWKASDAWIHLLSDILQA